MLCLQKSSLMMLLLFSHSRYIISNIKLRCDTIVDSLYTPFDNITDIHMIFLQIPLSNQIIVTFHYKNQFSFAQKVGSK